MTSPPSTEEGQPADGLPGAARLRLMFLAVLLTAQVGSILAVPVPPVRLAAGLAAVIVLAALQTRHFRGPARYAMWRRLSLLAFEGLATYLPILAMGRVWPGWGGFLAGSVLIVLSGRVAWSLFTVVLVSVFSTAIALGQGVRQADNVTLVSLAIGLTLFGVFRFSCMIMKAYGMHTEVAQLAVVRERLRFARDLHDLLGYSLAAITLKAELIRRLLGSASATANNELRDVVDIARQAVAEVRQVAHGYRSVSLAQEVSAAASLLASASVAAHVEMRCEILPDKVDSALAMVLRELITNILRHSRARNCWITAVQDGDHITLSVANDGVTRTAATHRDGGGLENLAWRLEAIGGTLSATVRGDGRFRVLADIIVEADPPVGARPHRSGCSSS
jgi:two-component system sensor histidine kinase DesK